MNDDTSRFRMERWIAWLAVIGCCGVFTALVVIHARVSSATYDETAHLPAGYSYLKWGDYRLNPVHPPLVKKLAALPLFTRNVWQFDVEPSDDDLHPKERADNEKALKRSWAVALNEQDAEWYFGHYFLYGKKLDALQRVGAKGPLSAPNAARDADGAWIAPLQKSDFLNDADDLLFWGRMPVMLLGVALALLIFFWSRQLFGLAGGILSLALFCFDPNFIAHSGLVTTDVGAALFFCATIYCFWLACLRLTFLRAASFAVCVALALVTKFSAVLLLPMIAILAAWKIFSRKPWLTGAGDNFELSARPTKAVMCGALLLIAALAALLVIWAMYGFRFSAAKNPERAAMDESAIVAERDELHTPGRFPIEHALRHVAAMKSAVQSWDWSSRPDGPGQDDVKAAMKNVTLGFRARVLLFASRYRLLPEAYLFGLANVEERGQIHYAFLNGEYSVTGFRSYFIWTFLLKTPLPALLAILVAVAVAARRREWRGTLLFLAVPVAVYWLATIFANLNIGHRHLLPIYPFLYVLCGALGAEWDKWRVNSKPWVAAVALVWIAWSAFFVFAPSNKRDGWKPDTVQPHSLAYFNELAGGPHNGYLWLVDSNLDWGQDLKKLKRWLDENQITEPVNLCYFGMADPRYHGIAFVNMPDGYALAPPIAPEPRRLTDARLPGYLVVSATNYQGATLSEADRKVWQLFLKDAKFVAQIGYSLFIFKLDRAPR